MDPFDSVRWTNFGQLWRNISFALRGFPVFMPGYCDECGLRDCFDPGCQRTREAIFADVDELRCTCFAIRAALGKSERYELIGGHEPDCVCTNGITTTERVIVDDATFNKLANASENPRAPTEDLRALMTNRVK